MVMYRVKGIYEMKFFVDVNELVQAGSEEEAVEKVMDGISAGQAYDQECKWVDAGPDVETAESEAERKP
jgi:hypothetical protein